MYKDNSNSFFGCFLCVFNNKMKWFITWFTTDNKLQLSQFSLLVSWSWSPSSVLLFAVAAMLPAFKQITLGVWRVTSADMKVWSVLSQNTFSFHTTTDSDILPSRLHTAIMGHLGSNFETTLLFNFCQKFQFVTNTKLVHWVTRKTLNKLTNSMGSMIVCNVSGWATSEMRAPWSFHTVKYCKRGQ